MHEVYTISEAQVEFGVEAQRAEIQLDTLAEAINKEHSLCEAAVNSAVTHAMNAGGMLSEVKASLKHGEFGPWLKENFAGSDRTARVYMRVHAHRDELEAKRQSSATLSIDGALKALSAPKEEAEAEQEAPKRPATFEDMVEATAVFTRIRDTGAWRQSGHATFEEYLKARWPGVTTEIIEVWEDVAKDPPRALRGAPSETVIELCYRLKELEALPSRDPGLPAVGRALLEIEEKELYKLAGHATVSDYCSERLGLTRRQKEVLILYAELAEVLPTFDDKKLDLEFPEDMERKDWERLLNILAEIEALSGPERGVG